MMIKSILNDLNGDNADFVSKVPFFITVLKEELKLNNTDLDFSKDSLSKIDIKLFSLERIDDKFIEKMLLPLTAYMGEVWIKNHGGNWKLDFLKEFNVYSPFIEFRNKKIIFHDCIADVMFEDELPSIKSCYIASEMVSYPNL